eukprot:CAMPEP_0179198460 /NCGR_PEP_ID=MMETSP0796-20121207/98713_1 /TAXON_ID=73915 /ORGANISM="Pyrodinium bahamense, Strain pbaha01" /LENGTH=209 /DNA_ID=CAMNT_0020902915 /DNA_START=246 /DNA_END=872 /DNA_ORIENTATION=-
MTMLPRNDDASGKVDRNLQTGPLKLSPSQGGELQRAAGQVHGNAKEPHAAAVEELLIAVHGGDPTFREEELQHQGQAVQEPSHCVQDVYHAERLSLIVPTISVTFVPEKPPTASSQVCKHPTSNKAWDRADNEHPGTCGAPLHKERGRGDKLAKHQERSVREVVPTRYEQQREARVTSSCATAHCQLVVAPGGGQPALVEPQGLLGAPA